MRYLVLLICTVTLTSFQDAKYTACDTASAITWLSTEEKQVFYYVNRARMFPKEFAAEFVLKDKKKSGYYGSLYQTLVTMKALPALKPDKTLFDYALCFSKEAGTKGYVGHKRMKCADGKFAECCSYGMYTALEIVMQLLVDDGLPSLGHRKILLDAGHSRMGVSIQPHKQYGTNAVLDIQ